MIRAIVAGSVLAIALGCSDALIPPVAPTLDPEAATRLLTAADEARAAAFASADPGPLRPLFADAAIGPLASQLSRLRRRGQRIEERGSSRRLVHWSASSGWGEGVLETTGEQRLVSPAGDRQWARIARQWRARLAWSGGRWLVDEAGDVPPNLWWKA